MRGCLRRIIPIQLVTQMDIPDEDKAIFEPIKRFAYAQGFLHGEIAAAKRLLLRLGNTKYGQHGPAVAVVIDAISNAYRLEDLSARVFTASSWDDLLASN